MNYPWKWVSIRVFISREREQLRASCLKIGDEWSGANFQGGSGFSDTQPYANTHFYREMWTVFVTSTDWCLSALVLLATGETGGVIIDCAWRDNFSGFMSWTFNTGNTGYLLKKEKSTYTSCHYTHGGKSNFPWYIFSFSAHMKAALSLSASITVEVKTFFSLHTPVITGPTALTHLLTTLITVEG